MSIILEKECVIPLDRAFPTTGLMVVRKMSAEQITCYTRLGAIITPHSLLGDLGGGFVLF